jgi:hypothetical protein
MAFLTPLFLAGLVGLAIPIVLHLIQRERKNVIEFPSLMFLRKIPYESVQRRRIRNWPLLLLRLAVLALIVAAFARPFLRRDDLSAAGTSGAREVVILVDRSYSMAYGDRWQRAQAAARDAVRTLAGGERASLVFFSSGAEVAVRSTSDRARLEAAIASTQPGSSATRFSPALKLAGSLLSESQLPRREALLITDFQRNGWQGADGSRLPDGAVLTPFVIGDGETTNVMVTPVTLQRTTFAAQERVTVTAGVMNRGARPADVDLTLEIDGRALQTQRVRVDPNGASSATFAPFTLTGTAARGTVRITADSLDRDNAYHFVSTRGEPVRVVLAERPGTGAGSLYLTRALAVGETPKFEVTAKSAEAVTADDLQRAAVLILNDVPVSPQLADRAARFAERGGGILVVAGERATWPTGHDVLPASAGAPIDRTRGDAGRIGALEYGHPVFEVFRAPRTGDFPSAHFYNYRSVSPAKDAKVLARFDDGAAALVERQVGNGRVLLWTSTIDQRWNDLALKPVFLPFVHRLVRYLGAYREASPWHTVGDVVQPPAPAPPSAARAVMKERVVRTPAGARLTLDAEGPDVLELTEHGFYEVRSAGRESDAPIALASNVDLAESDLTPMDPQELVTTVAGRTAGATASGIGAAATDEAQEKMQRVWWYLLFAGLMLLAGESVLANRTTR